MANNTRAKKYGSDACRLVYIKKFLYICSAQSLRKEAEWEYGPKHNEMTEKKFWVIQTKSITVFGRYSFCLESFSVSPAFTLLASAKFLSFSNLMAFKDLVFGQKKILTPDGESGRIQKKSQFQILVMNDVLGLKAILSR